MKRGNGRTIAPFMQRRGPVTAPSGRTVTLSQHRTPASPSRVSYRRKSRLGRRLAVHSRPSARLTRTRAAGARCTARARTKARRRRLLPRVSVVTPSHLSAALPQGHRRFGKVWCVVPAPPPGLDGEWGYVFALFTRLLRMCACTALAKLVRCYSRLAVKCSSCGVECSWSSKSATLALTECAHKRRQSQFPQVCASATQCRC